MYDEEDWCCSSKEWKSMTRPYQWNSSTLGLIGRLTSIGHDLKSWRSILLVSKSYSWTVTLGARNPG